ncbi:VOC family protein [Actinacidiphila bryophytorum]|uniref:Anthracycline biosynthesis protein DauV n=1 Tax=Actinacidiphila bryophytorum TaxID=1436133 RepID=A0A9W4MJF1_9ACTN|nr:VOC family protein [Actinacidiphila bryophytorum]MBM9436777.1 VOC family protein [Actinacidiphila bryophytorum]MBN6547296.1 VOC family protein [Actinacidiphila bryophytorum]CAG7654286.1 putative Anthracycline biosynthesis protein DauV [Actinacidiphila bryophytorum]
MTTEVPSRRLPGTPCWASLMAHRADLARDFYGTLFGWEFTPGPPQLGSYSFAQVGGLRVAGIGEGAPEPHRPVSWTTMLAVDDVDHAAESVRECGGTVGIGPLNIGEDGRLAVAVDPSGAVFGIWQSGLFAGSDVTGVPGSVARSELVTNDATLVGKFYEAVFGFGSQRAGGDEEDLTVLTLGGQPVADVRGVGRNLPRDRGAHWVTAFAVEDVQAAADQAVRLGGRVLAPPHEDPLGTAATVADPEGAAFGLLARG